MIQDWQQILSLAIVACTAVILVRSEIARRKRSASRACGRGCACPAEGVSKKQPQDFPTTA